MSLTTRFAVRFGKWKTQFYTVNISFFLFNLLAPLRPSNLKVEQQHFVQNILDLDVSWSMPTHLPDNYTMMILDLYKERERIIFNVPGNVSSYSVSNITILGSNFEVYLIANSQGGRNISEIYLTKIPLKKGLFSWPYYADF